MEAKTLNCPMCGAPTSTEASRCAHCNARLATVSCPSCFGMIFLGSKFCSHCGARADRTELAAGKTQACPRCQTSLKLVKLGETDLGECPKCEGIWAEAMSLQKICTDREQQAAVLGMAMNLAAPNVGTLERVKYVPCPQCRRLMNRVNFANCSNVVVDVCKPHGTWFDKDELRRVVEFIRGGGIEKSRLQQIDEMERERRQLDSARIANARADGSVDYCSHPSHSHDLLGTALGAVTASILSSILD